MKVKESECFLFYVEIWVEDKAKNVLEWKVKSITTVRSNQATQGWLTKADSMHLRKITCWISLLVGRGVCQIITSLLHRLERSCQTEIKLLYTRGKEMNTEGNWVYALC
ncbi:hypothetical protein V6N13_064202 [Hibiscus sabdariffa]